MGALETTFIIIGAVGFGYFLISLIIGEVFEGIDGLFEADLDFDIDGESGPSFISGRTLAAGMVGFGSGGFIAAYYDLNSFAAILIALAAMLMVMAGSFYAIVIPLYRSEHTDVYPASTLVGKSAYVTLPIRSGETGQVSVVDGSGARVYKNASASDDTEFPHGSNVIITEITPSGVIVSQ